MRRLDIDGLRALAVLMVIIFHAFPRALPGGFIGVDVFFVISGYLISGHILQAVSEGHFSFLEFYAKRCRRILPALLLVLGCVWIIGRDTLLAGEFSQLGKHLMAGAAFVSNITLYQESGYFDGAANLKPLLHLWSLAIEEQFYLVWPLFLFSFRKKKSISLLLAVLIADSFLINISESRHNLTAAFFLLPSRFWELLVGAALAHLEMSYPFLLKRFENTKSIIAVSLLVLGGFFLRNNFLFPGFWALIPTVSAFLFISAGEASWMNRKIFSSAPLTAIGLISYPLYLWHWPLLSFLRITSDGVPPVNSKLAMILASFLLAWLTRVSVEVPAQKYLLLASDYKTRVRNVVLLSICALIVMGDLGLLTYRGKLQSDIQLANSALGLYGYNLALEEQFWKSGCFLTASDKVDKFERNHCLTKNFPGRPTFYLLGDSHSAYLSLGLRPFLQKNKVNFGQFSAGWCTPLDSAERTPRCAAINKYVLSQIQQNKPDIVVIFTNYQQYPTPNDTFIRDFDQSIADRTREIEALGVKHILVLGQMPTWNISLASVLSRHFVIKREPVPLRTLEGVMPSSLIEDLKLKGQKFSDNTTFVSLHDQLCNEDGCLTQVGPDLATDLIVFDYGHMTKPGAEYVTEKALLPKLQEWIK